MHVKVNANEWKRAKELLKAIQAKGEPDAALKISRKDDPENILKHSFHYVDGKLFAADYNPDENISYYIGRGARGKAKLAVDENGTEYILKITAIIDENNSNTLRIIAKKKEIGDKGIYHSYFRSLLTPKEHFQRATPKSWADKDPEHKLYTEKKLTEIFEKKGGVELFDLLVDSNLSDTQKMIAAIQACLEVHHFHKDLRELHRDIKLSNMVVNKQRIINDPYDIVVTLIDLNECIELPKDSTYIFGSKTIGSPDYIPPEMFKNVASVAGDVYSLGVLVNQLLHTIIVDEKLPENTLLLLAQMYEPDPTRRPSIPDIIHFLWDALPNDLKNSGNTFINAIQQRINTLPPPRTEYEIQLDGDLDTPEKLAVSLWSQIWIELTEQEQKDVEERFSPLTHLKVEPTSKSILELLDRVSDSVKKEMYSYTNTNALLKKLTHEQNTIKATLVEGLEEMTGRLWLYLSDDISLPAGFEKIQSRLGEIQHDRGLDFTSQKIELLVQPLLKSWDSLLHKKQYDPEIKNQIKILAQLWSALPEESRRDKNLATTFNFIAELWDPLVSHSDTNKEGKIFSVLSAEFALQNMTYSLSTIARSHSGGKWQFDPFTALANELLERLDTSGPLKISTEDLISEYRKIFTAHEMYSPRLNRKLELFAQDVTGNSQLVGDREVRFALTTLINDIESHYRKGLEFYKNEVEQPSIKPQ